MVAPKLENDELTDQRDSPGNFDDGLAQEFGVHPLRPTRRRRLLPIVVAIVLLTIGSVLVFLLYSMYSDGLPSFASPQILAPLTADTGVKLEEFSDFRRQANRFQQSTEQLLKAHQSELVRLSDQLNLLAEKVDLLQHPAAPVVDPLPSPPIRTSPVRKRNSTSPRRPASDISVGGAPLPGR